MDELRGEPAEEHLEPEVLGPDEDEPGEEPEPEEEEDPDGGDDDFEENVEEEEPVAEPKPTGDDAIRAALAGVLFPIDRSLLMDRLRGAEVDYGGSLIPLSELVGLSQRSKFRSAEEVVEIAQHVLAPGTERPIFKTHYK